MAGSATQNIAQFKRVKAKRLPWDDRFQEVSDIASPERQFNVEVSPGERRRLQMFSKTMELSKIFLAGALHGQFTNPSIVWMGLRLQNMRPGIEISEEEQHEAKIWLKKTTDRMLALFNSPGTGFGTAMHELWLDEISVSVGIILIHDETGKPIRYQAKSLSDCYLVADHMCRVIGLYCVFKMTAAEVVTKWPKTASQATRDLAKDGSTSWKEVDVLHYMFERNERDPERSDGPNKPWGSIYDEIDEETRLSEGGFDHQPWVSPRWSKLSGNVYGGSPCMSAMEEAKALNVIVKTVLIGGEMAVAPPRFVDTNGIDGPMSMRPHGIIRTRTGSRVDPVRKADLSGKVEFGVEIMQLWESKIKEFFFIDLLQLPLLDRMTATEVIARQQQQLRVLSPILSRQYEELLTPLIDSTYKIMLKRGDIDKPPDAVKRIGIEIDYVSPLALSQKSSESQGFLQAMQVATPLIQTDETVMKNIKADKTFRSIFLDMFNVNPEFLHSPDEMIAIREQEAKENQEAKQAQLAQVGASAFRDSAAGIKDVNRAG